MGPGGAFAPPLSMLKDALTCSLHSQKCRLANTQKFFEFVSCLAKT